MSLWPSDTQTHPSSQTHAEMPTMHLGRTHKPKQLGVAHLSAEHMCSHLPFCIHPQALHGEDLDPGGNYQFTPVTHAGPDTQTRSPMGTNSHTCPGR